MSDYSDLVQRLRDLTDENYGDLDQFSTWGREMVASADAIELLQRELKCSKEMWEQQQELALEYLADIEKANERIEELEAALKPFAEITEQQNFKDYQYNQDDCVMTAGVWGFKPDFTFKLGDLRQARKVLGEKE